MSCLLIVSFHEIHSAIIANKIKSDCFVISLETFLPFFTCSKLRETGSETAPRLFCHVSAIAQCLCTFKSLIDTRPEVRDDGRQPAAAEACHCHLVIVICFESFRIRIKKLHQSLIRDSKLTSTSSTV